ncbi:acyl-CoA/acyl-ACP dehydrogenase [Actinopolyspora sp. BKK1]|nr:acyl-CoA/acyl-ACP dehydrogenase [Actinopolyspora sp. BKK2]NHE74722.1 acyl-CoA/acyl-ACP dehydrogenase [Actinopolyspora sp. BKK1]
MLAERSSASDLRGSPDTEVLTALRESDVVGLVVPKRFGGSGSDFLELNRTIAQLAYYDPSVAIIAFQHLAVCARIVERGTRRQQEKLLPELASGHMLAASAWSESGAGADKKNLSTVAEESSDGSWSVSGGKAFTTGAGLADVYLVLAQSTDVRDLDSSYGAHGQSFFLIPADNPGIRPDTGLDLVGMRSSATGFVQLHECVLPGDALLGPRDEAGSIIAEVKRSGATLGAVSLGIAESACDLVQEFARNKGVLGHQAQRHRLVELRARVEAARGLVERAGAGTSGAPGNTTLYSKIFAAETSEEVVQALARMLGSTGYVSTNPINRMQRDARAVALMGPTNDLSRELVSTSWTV